MDISAFDGLINKKLSVALNKIKKDGTPESYIGYLKSAGTDFIILDYAKASTKNTDGIETVILLVESIIGVWVYKTQ